jgi:AcrR family transcriptional regulator
MQTVQIDGMIAAFRPIGRFVMTSKNPTERREKLILTAAALIVEHGAGALTLDAVAASAGVSKGGLLHHFPTKHALIQGMLMHLTEQFVRRQDALLAREAPGTPGRWLRAYIDISLAEFEEIGMLDQAITRLVTLDPALRTQLEHELSYLDDFARNDGLPYSLATLIRLACDGYWLGCIYGMPLVTGDDLTQLRARLIDMTRVAQPQA